MARATAASEGASLGSPRLRLGAFFAGFFAASGFVFPMHQNSSAPRALRKSPCDACTMASISESGMSNPSASRTRSNVFVIAAAVVALKLIHVAPACSITALTSRASISPRLLDPPPPPPSSSSVSTTAHGGPFRAVANVRIASSTRARPLSSLLGMSRTINTTPRDFPFAVDVPFALPFRAPRAPFPPLVVGFKNDNGSYLVARATYAANSSTLLAYSIP